MAALGLVLLAVTYGMYRDAVWQDKMLTHVPIFCMKITYGTRGAGTVRNPYNVYAEYHGKTYNFEMGLLSTFT